MTIMNYYIAIEKDLQQIGELLLLNGTLTEDPGLVHGKMGIAVFLFHYAQYTENMLFADYAMDLIGEIQNQLHVDSCADYEKGVQSFDGAGRIQPDGIFCHDSRGCCDGDGTNYGNGNYRQQ